MRVVFGHSCFACYSNLLHCNVHLHSELVGKQQHKRTDSYSAQTKTHTLIVYTHVDTQHAYANTRKSHQATQQLVHSIEDRKMLYI
jgi:hypothetical protein